MKKAQYGLLLFMAIGSGLGGGALSSGVRHAVAQAPPEHAKTIRASEFLVVDSDGKVRATLGVLVDGTPHISLFEKNGKRAVTLGLIGTGSGLALHNNKGEVRAALAIVEGAPCLELYDENGNLSTFIGFLEGEPRVTLHDKTGKMRALLDVSEGEPHLVLRDKNGNLRVFVGLIGGDPRLMLQDKEGSRMTEQGSGLKLRDKDGQTRALLGCTTLETTRTGEVTKRPASSLVLFDKEGKVIFEAP